jgi:hypothetical protein
MTAMRKFSTAGACLLAMTLSACDGTSEAYAVGSSDAYYTLSESGYSRGIYPLPAGLAAMKVDLTFGTAPTDQTAYWKFTRDGKEIGRVNALVDGDATSSTISYNYARGDADEVKLERLVHQFMPQLISETVDAKIENRAYDAKLRDYADTMTAMATIKTTILNASAAMDKAVKESDERLISYRAQAGVDSARRSSAKPTTDLSDYR